MKYVNYDAEGKILAYYDDAIHANIPDTCVEINDDEWQAAIEMNANFFDVETKTFSVKDFRTDIEILDEVKKLKLSELKAMRDKEVSNIVVTTAKNFILDGDELSQTRMTRAVLALPDDNTDIQWIGANGDVYKLTRSDLAAALFLAGELQTQIFNKYATLKTQVNEATTVSEIEAVIW